MVAAQGALYISSSSPNHPSGPYVATLRGEGRVGFPRDAPPHVPGLATGGRENRGQGMGGGGLWPEAIFYRSSGRVLCLPHATVTSNGL